MAAFKWPASSRIPRRERRPACCLDKEPPRARGLDPHLRPREARAHAALPRRDRRDRARRALRGRGRRQRLARRERRRARSARGRVSRAAEGRPQRREPRLRRRQQPRRRHATGAHLVLLNNDTEPQPGWLEALLAIGERPDTGAVGAKLVYPDGRLQEAGGIVFADASGWNYGRGGDPDDPRYAFVREVDYCSGACLLVPRAVWDAVGGFDERYAPAYYEDTDLCFAVRERGLKVVYQPAAVIVHHEGATAGTDTASGFKRHQVVNRERFREKWARRCARSSRRTRASCAARATASPASGSSSSIR